MEVPLSYGPWKFGGLPGLILKVYDVEHLYTFESVRVEAVAAPIKSLRYKSFKPISKKKVLKFERMINEDNHKVLSGYSGEKKPYEPLELE
jgi:GLPGLI family protein